MTTHTPGPWSCERPVIRGMHASISNGGNINIAHIDNVNGFSGDSDANARLIAAAPEMYEALKAAAAALDGMISVFDYLADKGYDEECNAVMEAYNVARAALARADGRE